MGNRAVGSPRIQDLERARRGFYEFTKWLRPTNETASASVKSLLKRTMLFTPSRRPRSTALLQSQSLVFLQLACFPQACATELVQRF
jgi:hypothetical protein